MQLTISRAHLASAIQAAARAASNKSTLPILTGIKFEATYEGLRLIGYDLETAIETFIPAEDDGYPIVQIVQPGQVVIPAKTFLEIVKKLPDYTVEIEVTNANLVKIRSGKSKFQLHGLDAEDFPRLPNIHGMTTMELPSDQFKTWIRRTVFAAETDENTNRPYLKGVAFTLRQGSLTIVATDSHRLARTHAEVPDLGDVDLSNIIIPGKALKELIALLPDDEAPVTLAISDRLVSVQFGTTKWHSRLLEGHYPDTSRIIPTNFKTTIRMNVKTLQDAIERAALIAKSLDDSLIRLKISEDSVSITSQSAEVGGADEEVLLESFRGDKQVIAVNSKYVLDVLRVIDAEAVEWNMIGPNNPVVIQPVNDAAQVYLVLPVRTQG